MVTIVKWNSTSSQFHSVRLFCFLQSDSIRGCVPWKVCLSGTLKFRWHKIDQKSDFQHYCPCHAIIQPLSTPAHLHYCPCPPPNSTWDLLLPSTSDELSLKLKKQTKQNWIHGYPSSVWVERGSGKANQVFGQRQWCLNIPKKQRVINRLTTNKWTDQA